MEGSVVLARACRWRRAEELGRLPLPEWKQRQIRRRWREGGQTLTSIAREARVDRSTVSKYVRDLVEEEASIVVADDLGDEERWRPVPYAGYSNCYECSSEGRVRNRRTKKLLRSQRAGKTEYRKVTLSLGGPRRQVRLARMICAAFHGPPSCASLVVHHKNSRRDDDRAVNLHWCSYSYNALHGSRSRRGVWL